MNIGSVDSITSALQQVTPPPADGREARTQGARGGQVSGTEGLKEAQAVAPGEAEPTNVQSAASGEMVQNAVETIQKVVETITQDLRFSVDKESNRTVIKVVDTKTDEIIRQIPTEEVLEIARSLGKLNGLLVRETA